MKKLFGTCLDKNSDDKIAEEDFLVKNYEDEKLFEELEEITQRYDSSISKSRFAYTAKYLAISVISIALTLISFRLVSPMTEAEGASPAPLFIPMFFALLGIITLGYYRKKNVSFVSSEDMMRLKSEKAKETKKLYANVGVPENAVTVDILDYFYETDKNGSEIIKSIGSLLPMWAYEQEDKIFFSDEYSLFAFPKSSFREIHYVEKSFQTCDSEGNNPYSLNSAEYSEYITSYASGIITHKGYISVLICNNEEEYELRLPAYETSALSKLTGLFPKR